MKSKKSRNIGPKIGSQIGPYRGPYRALWALEGGPYNSETKSQLCPGGWGTHMVGIFNNFTEIWKFNQNIGKKTFF